MHAQPRTISVPEAGDIYFGVGRDASYEAAKNGLIIVIKVGRLLRVPIAAMDRKFERIGEQDEEQANVVACVAAKAAERDDVDTDGNDAEGEDDDGDEDDE